MLHRAAIGCTGVLFLLACGSPLQGDAAAPDDATEAGLGPTSGTVSTVLSANVHGTGLRRLYDWRERRPAFARHVQEAGGPRVLILHEFPRDGVRDMQDALHRQGVDYLYASEVCVPKEGLQITGTVLLSRSPFDSEPFCVRAPLGGSSKLVKGRIRGLSIIGFHSGDPADIAAAANLFDATAGPVVLGGDFNRPPNDRYMAPVYQRGSDVYGRQASPPTFPLPHPSLRIDYLFHRGLRQAPTGVTTAAGSAFSDHNTVRASFAH